MKIMYNSTISLSLEDSQNKDKLPGNGLGIPSTNFPQHMYSQQGALQHCTWVLPQQLEGGYQTSYPRPYKEHNYQTHWPVNHHQVQTSYQFESFEYPSSARSTKIPEISRGSCFDVSANTFTEGSTISEGNHFSCQSGRRNPTHGIIGE